MFNDIGPKMKCGECGSENYERFSNQHKSGIRCLECGHEHIEKRKQEWDQVPENVAYNHIRGRTQKF